jgi:hypothetical protein
MSSSGCFTDWCIIVLKKDRNSMIPVSNCMPSNQQPHCQCCTYWLQTVVKDDTCQRFLSRWLNEVLFLSKYQRNSLICRLLHGSALHVLELDVTIDVATSCMPCISLGQRHSFNAQWYKRVRVCVRIHCDVLFAERQTDNGLFSFRKTFRQTNSERHISVVNTKLRQLEFPLFLYSVHCLFTT